MSSTWRIESEFLLKLSKASVSKRASTKSERSWECCNPRKGRKVFSAFHRQVGSQVEMSREAREGRTLDTEPCRSLFVYPFIATSEVPALESGASPHLFLMIWLQILGLFCLSRPCQDQLPLPGRHLIPHIRLEQLVPSHHPCLNSSLLLALPHE